MPGVAQTNPAIPMNSAQFAALPPDQQSAYLKTLPPQSQAQLLRDVRVINNRKFMRNAIEKYAYCPVSGGSGVTAAYTPGTTLVFDLPVVGSGYAKALIITYSLTITLATGTFANTAANPWNFFSELVLNYNGAQLRCHPYLLKVIDIALGFSRGQQNTIVAGNTVANLSTQILAQPSPTAAANAYYGKFYLRLNAIDEMSSVPGMLPVMGVGNKPQLKLTCSPGTLGSVVSATNSCDPLLVPIAQLTAGTLTSATGTVQVDMVYYDGTTMTDPSGLVLDLTAEPTLQYYWDTPLNPLTSGTLVRQHIATLLEHWMVVSIVIDGNQHSAFTAIPSATPPFNQVNGLTSFQLSADSVGQQNFQSWNVANNIQIYDYYDRKRRTYGQDFDPGVIVWIDAAVRGIPNSDNRNGSQVLNMQAGGFPATTHAYQLSAVGAPTNYTPRVETFVVSLNYNGLKIA